ncbi:hypothetical protein TVAG_468290 [Trichomonas vaginalis G3]|uniref:Right handed beta helix domain-containing protein n=1 Tax=Trichomonas vaginalis (strain ATCC PRA-98 / G3) TaxID=412133 RepID=A2E0R8_TRIV3|nr:pectin lyase-like family [Trichomonas vaginalis G3]EAY13813.1 hypothetical protein TVAG_468290 [Trichomonas vaginalis G3]KAI5542673.1 pectin lyase-like family [Trichomonas vaginalis G3]|eukprot:XP_001326036.1 hypothetical protein [Trichomonas vaginalis G3]
MNLTITRLLVADKVLPSPLFSRNFQSDQHISFSLSFSRFNKITNTILSGIPSQKYQVYQTKFNKIIGSAIKIDGLVKETNQRIEKQIISKESDNVIIEDCIFTNLVAERGAAIYGRASLINITKSVFSNCHSNVGGAINLLESAFINLNDDQFYNNSAKYSAGCHMDTRYESDSSLIQNTNSSQNHAELWTGAMRIDRAGGHLLTSYFVDNHAFVSGAFFDFAFKTTTRTVKMATFLNNSAQCRGGAFTCFHMMHKSRFDTCNFVLNHCDEQAHSISLESVYQVVNITNCKFDGPKDAQVSSRYGESELNIDDTNKFDVNQDQIPELPQIKKFFKLK